MPCTKSWQKTCLRLDTKRWMLEGSKSFKRFCSEALQLVHPHWVTQPAGNGSQATAVSSESQRRKKVVPCYLPICRLAAMYARCAVHCHALM